MVKAIVEIDERANEVINLLKARYGLNDKSQAINEMARQYKELILESDIRPEYLTRFRKIWSEPIIRVGSYKDFKKRYKVK
jgi:cytochrome c peroxidase